MPVPNTGGVLRTKVADMQVGDYIKATAQTYPNSASNYNIKFELSPTYATSEFPVTGLAETAGGWNSFYFIKANKGLLISDRVIQHSVSWDKLNGAKFIQGLPWDNGNIIPTMTSNIAPSGVASGTNSYSSSYDYWHVFDGNDTTRYISTGKTGEIGYEFTAPKKITSYKVTGTSGMLTRNPKDWTFEGWDGSNWVVLDTQKGISWQSATQKRTFNFKNNLSFIKYRINITDNNGDTNMDVTGLEMFEISGIIRSLGGGCAYADASGNPVTTDQGLGAAPTDNEWDTYIVKKDYGTGAGRDDVWHWNTGVRTWVQETIAPGVTMGGNTGSDKRVARGRDSLTTPGGAQSSATTVNFGFRPVFQYDEVTP